ncbi:MAG: PorV/PorQ family protein [Spirochaetes bacterium]|nr:PorV/PorQ family protein [Spirochaetota bacterium]
MKKNIISFIGLSFCGLFCLSALQASPLLLLDAHNSRSFGLAETGVAFKGDMDMMDINPAASASMPYTAVSGFYIPWFADTRFLGFTLGLPMSSRRRDYGSLGINLSAFYSTPFPNYDALGKRLDDLEVNDFLLIVNYAYPFRILDLGINFKYFNTSLGQSKSRSVSFDIGAIQSFRIFGFNFETIKNNFHLGLSLQNIGFAQKFVSEETSLPLKVRAGFRYDFYNHEKINISLIPELIYTSGEDMKGSLAMEFFLLKYYHIRLGYRVMGNVLHKLALGLGIKESKDTYNIIIDYSYIPLEDLEICHAFSLKFEFGKKPEVKQEEKSKEETANLK